MLFHTQCGYSRSAVFMYATLTGRGFTCSGKVPQGFSRPIPIQASRKRQHNSAVDGDLRPWFAFRLTILDIRGPPGGPFLAHRVGFERRPERRVYP